MNTSIDKIFTSTAAAIAKSIYQCISKTTFATMLAPNFHWNVDGKDFVSLHTLFKEICEDHFSTQDKLAEGMLKTMLNAPKTIASTLTGARRSCCSPR